MKVFRIVAILIAVAIPGAAIANHVMSSSDDSCCPNGPCCHDGSCPLCHHHAK